MKTFSVKQSAPPPMPPITPLSHTQIPSSASLESSWCQYTQDNNPTRQKNDGCSVDDGSNPIYMSVEAQIVTNWVTHSHILTVPYLWRTGRSWEQRGAQGGAAPRLIRPAEPAASTACPTTLSLCFYTEEKASPGAEGQNGTSVTMRITMAALPPDRPTAKSLCHCLQNLSCNNKSIPSLIDKILDFPTCKRKTESRASCQGCKNWILHLLKY